MSNINWHDKSSIEYCKGVKQAYSATDFTQLTLITYLTQFQVDKTLIIAMKTDWFQQPKLEFFVSILQGGLVFIV